MGKKRARDNRPFEVKLCSSLSKGESCEYGSSCRFSHDVKAFLDAKLPDLGETCYLFEKYGKCPYGLSCRYGSAHIDLATMTCVTKDDFVEITPQINLISKNLQTLLRKRKYFPSRAEVDAKKTPADAASAASEETTALETAAPEHVPPPVEGSVPVPPVPAPVLVEPTAAVAVVPPAAAAPKWEKGSFDASAFPLKEVKLVDFSNKVYIAPLTTVGNLPFRRVMKDFGADITCGEMALGFNLNQGQSSEWALMRRHQSEDVFGIQICGGKADLMRDTAKILNNETQSDFIDLNCGCPIDVVCDRGGGSALMLQPNKLCNVVSAMTANIHNRSVTVKIRTGWDDKAPTAHKLIPQIQKISRGKIAAIMMHGRSRLQRYTKLANWDYVLEAARSQDPTMDRIPVIGNGDIMSYVDWTERQTYLQDNFDGDEIGLCNCAMVGRGALIKPWLPKEIKEKRNIDISATERFDMLKNFVNYGFEHWGSDTQGVSTTRRFLLEWLSYLCRYAPEPLMANPPQKINMRPVLLTPGRSDLETLLGSSNPQDWIKISEMLMGPCPEGFHFTPKHQSNSYERQSFTAPSVDQTTTTSLSTTDAMAGETVSSSNAGDSKE